MPSNLLKLSSSSMESEFERSGSFDSQSSQRSRSRSHNFDDENLKYLTNEEKNALMFLEETLDAFEDDLEEPPLSANSSIGYYSPRSTEDSHSDTEDIIDLVQTELNHVGISPEDSRVELSSSSWNHSAKDAWTSQSTMKVGSPLAVSQMDSEKFSPDLSEEYWKLHGAIPTPVIIAQKMAEKKSDSENMSPLSPKAEKSPEPKKSVGTSPINEGHFIFPGSPTAKSNRFPNNIIIKPVGKQYNKTIAKAAVNVQERKAQVLANLHGPGLFTDENDAKNQLGRRTSFREPSEQTRYEALTKLGLVKEIPVQADFPSAVVCKSPIHSPIQSNSVSNGEHSPKMLPPETNRKHSNEPESISKLGLVKEIPIQADSPSAVVYKSSIHSPMQSNSVSNGEHSPKMLPPETNRKHSNEHESISRILMNEPSTFVSLGKTVLIKGEAASSLERNKRPSSLQVAHEKKQTNTHQEIKRTYSMPRPAGLWSQGITVQFSGRNSSEESRKDALRRLGLLSGH